ncbi:MAG: hypothetical protein ABIZ04_23885 [Opitutus sp.]
MTSEVVALRVLSAESVDRVETVDPAGVGELVGELDGGGEIPTSVLATGLAPA